MADRQEGAAAPAGRLYVCGTPIGNLEDVTLRLLRILGEVDRVAAEDTRRTRKLLTHHGIALGPARLVSYHQANEHARVPELVAHLQAGERIALVTDAGMPAISDPGYLLVDACLREGIAVEVVPGPSAVTAALAVAGLPTARFAFEGFLPRKVGERRRRLEAAGAEDRTLVFFESPERILRTLEEIRDVLGERRVAVARELTKVHEEVLRGTASEVVAAVGGRRLRGEIVVLVEGATRRRRTPATPPH
ncbi:MAG: 16S rRNA (cytidine(1402)-2'-O)-methyltransferase [Actinomycetota bacterium]